MNPLLIAILGAVAHADGDTPTLTPDPTPEPTTIDARPSDPVTYDIGPDLVEGELIQPSCVDKYPRGTPSPLPIANQNQIAAVEKDCRNRGGTAAVCDASQMVSMAAAICASSIKTPLEVRIDVHDNNGAPRLVWRVQNHTGSCGGRDDYVDGWSAEVLGTGACVYGRPCGIDGGFARARVVRGRGWA